MAVAGGMPLRDMISDDDDNDDGNDYGDDDDDGDDSQDDDTKYIFPTFCGSAHLRAASLTNCCCQAAILFY